MLSADARVLLVRHSYTPGWHLPGGGVERGEDLGAALVRELKEEGNVDVLQPPVLHGLFFHPHYSDRDHVAVFVVREFRQESAPKPNHEIVETGFFPLHSLPAGTTAATRARIREVSDAATAAEFW